MNISDYTSGSNYFSSNGCSIYLGEAHSILSKLDSNSVQSVVTSPPYWGLRDYNMDGQIGLESTLEDYVQALVRVFEEVRRVLKADGTLWLNIGDTYTSGNRKYRAIDKKNPARQMGQRPDTPQGLKRKDLIGLPWRIALALQAEGWYLRTDIIWHKPNAMPESVTDRPYRNHEYLFLFSKSEKYYFDKKFLMDGQGRVRRSVWEVPIKANLLNHNAVFPTELITPCIETSSVVGDLILDPFFGAGTVGVVCQQLKRPFQAIELNKDYVNIALKRLNWDVNIQKQPHSINFKSDPIDSAFMTT